jgi:hypothetical protein
MNAEGVAGSRRETPLMPDSHAERIAFAVGLAAIIALAIALIPAFGQYTSSAPAPEVQATSGVPEASEQTAYRPPATPRPTRPAKPATRAKPATSRTQPAASVRKPPVAVQTRVSFAAIRGDCWLEVRANTSAGKTLYIGTLAKGKSLNISARALWIRFGAPQNVDLKVNGDGASIPSNTLDVVVSPNGIRPAPA